jgi:hypothetical protein
LSSSYRCASACTTKPWRSSGGGENRTPVLGKTVCVILRGVDHLEFWATRIKDERKRAAPSPIILDVDRTARHQCLIEVTLFLSLFKRGIGERSLRLARKRTAGRRVESAIELRVLLFSHLGFCSGLKSCTAALPAHAYVDFPVEASHPRKKHFTSFFANG